MVIAGLVILGLCLGSFINALVYRLHWQEKHPKATHAEKERYSIRKGRSICPNCKKTLKGKDLIPVVSWLLLKGRCRYCDKAISSQYPLVEAVTSLLFIVSYVFWPDSLASAAGVLAFILWLVLLTGFIALLIYDIKYLILPNRIIFPLGGLAAVYIILQTVADNGIATLYSASLGFLIGGGLFYLLFQVSNGSWIGGGDVKLGFLLGALLGGPWPALLLLFLASFLGTLYSLPLMAMRKVKPKSRIPFGPFLIVGAVIVQLFGSRIIEWYNNLLGTGY